MPVTDNIDSLIALRDEAAVIAARASSRILEVYDSDFDVEHKKDDSPLTAADMAAHHEIVAGLEKLTPDIPILSEESAAIPFAERSQWQTYWLVDPLDGTKEFVKRNGEFTVNIALIDGADPVIGVVHVPVTDVCYMAARGSGTWKQESGGELTPVKVRELPTGAITVAGSRSHGNEALEQFVKGLGEVEMVSIGSSLKFCLVADGNADVYPRLGLTSEWDTAAAQCVVEEAGGQVTTLDMQPLRYNTKDSLLNPYFLVFGDQAGDWQKYLPDDLSA